MIQPRTHTPPPPPHFVVPTLPAAAPPNTDTPAFATRHRRASSGAGTMLPSPSPHPHSSSVAPSFPISSSKIPDAPAPTPPPAPAERDRIVRVAPEAAAGPGFLDKLLAEGRPIAERDRADGALMAVCALLASVDNRGLCPKEIAETLVARGWVEFSGDSPASIIANHMRNHERRSRASPLFPNPPYGQLLRKHALSGSASDTAIAPYLGLEGNGGRSRGIVYILEERTTGWVGPWQKAGVSEPEPEPKKEQRRRSTRATGDAGAEEQQPAQPRQSPTPTSTSAPTTAADASSPATLPSRTPAPSRPTEGRGARRKSQSALALAAAESAQIMAEPRRLKIKLRKSDATPSPATPTPTSTSTSPSASRRRSTAAPRSRSPPPVVRADDDDMAMAVDIESFDPEPESSSQDSSMTINDGGAMLLHPRAAWPLSVTSAFASRGASPTPSTLYSNRTRSAGAGADGESSDEDDDDDDDSDDADDYFLSMLRPSSPHSSLGFAADALDLNSCRSSIAGDADGEGPDTPATTPRSHPHSDWGGSPRCATADVMSEDGGEGGGADEPMLLEPPLVGLEDLPLLGPSSSAAAVECVEVVKTELLEPEESPELLPLRGGASPEPLSPSSGDDESLYDDACSPSAFDTDLLGPESVGLEELDRVWGGSSSTSTSGRATSLPLPHTTTTSPTPDDSSPPPTDNRKCFALALVEKVRAAARQPAPSSAAPSSATISQRRHTVSTPAAPRCPKLDGLPVPKLEAEQFLASPAEEKDEGESQPSASGTAVVYPLTKLERKVAASEIEGVPVFRTEVGGEAVLRRIDTDYVNATVLLAAAGLDKAKIAAALAGEKPKVDVSKDSAPGVAGTWVPLALALQLAQTHASPALPPTVLSVFLDPHLASHFPAPLPQVRGELARTGAAIGFGVPFGGASPSPSPSSSPSRKRKAEERGRRDKRGKREVVEEEEEQDGEEQEEEEEVKEVRTKRPATRSTTAVRKTVAANRPRRAKVRTTH